MTKSITIKVTNKSLQRLKELAKREKSKTARWLVAKIMAEVGEEAFIENTEPSKPDFRTIAQSECESEDEQLYED